MANRGLLVGYRLFFALLAFAAIVTEIATLVERDRFVPGNFFSYFTIEMNLFATAVFLLSILVPASRHLSFLRGASTLYSAIGSVAFVLLLSGIEGAEFTAVPWDNIVLHYVMPIAVVVDWFIDPVATHIRFREGLVWLAFPVTYGAYSLIRGPLVDWYPYPFLDPGENGYFGVGIAFIAILLLASTLIRAITAFTTFTDRTAAVSV